MGIDGYREINSYRKICLKIHISFPVSLLRTVDYGMNGYFGLKGKYSSKMAFDFRLSYSQVSDMYFFVTIPPACSTEPVHRQYDNACLLNASRRVTWNQNEKLQIVLRGNYYHYNLDSLAHPWHRPDFDATLGASYNLRDKILVDAELFSYRYPVCPGYFRTILN